MTKFLFVISFFSVVFRLGAQKFTEVALDAGIDHVFQVDLATFGGGAAVLDLNNDGFEDVYITGGNNQDVLYLNNADGTFTNIIEGAGFESLESIHTQGVASADINRDGFKDLLITTLYYNLDRELAPNKLFLNNGDNTFTDVTEQYGLDKYKSNSMGASFGDINLDGYPDLYIANYFSAPPKGIEIFNGETITNSFSPARDYLFINNGGRSFVYGSNIYNIRQYGFSFGGVFTDWDNDRDVDIIVANDFGRKAAPNVALRNDYPDKTLIDKGNNLGLNYGMNAMGIAIGDYNFDGWMDYYISNLGASLFVRNEYGEKFVEEFDSGVSLNYIYNAQYQGLPVSWGVNFFDFDHDTDLDLYVVNGALNPTIRPNPNFFFELRETGFFKEIGERYGVDDARIGRGSVVFDYDNDGDLDILVVNQNPRDPTENLPDARCLLYRNDNADGNWLKVQLKGISSESDGLGARIEIESNGRKLVREIDGGSSHMSHSGTIAHFGLGDAEEVESITIKWLGGHNQVLEDISANQLLKITEEGTQEIEVSENSLFLFPSYFTNEILIEYKLSTASPVELQIFDAHGRLIDTILKKDDPTQKGFTYWSTQRPLIHGMYFIVLRTADGLLTKKAIKL